jgi:phage/plasmid-like protein (TIGR03299 family)
MTAESMQDLQTNTLIGCTDERGVAWHKRDDLRRLPDGTLLEDNHYPGFIPLADVRRRLFHWQPVQASTAYLVPCPMEQAQFITAAGVAVRVVESQAGRHGLLRSDNDYDLGVFKTAKHHPYEVSLVREVERLTGSILGISTAGLLAKGGRAWVEFSLPETVHDPLSGFDYRPNLVKADSMDGSMALTTARTIYATVCDNTLTWNLLEASKAGQLFRRKHTAGFTDLQDERDALGLLEQTNDEFTAELHALVQQQVSAHKLERVLDMLYPLPVSDAKGKYTQSNNKREVWLDLYRNDERCAPWAGTAFGVVQTDNTFQHHYATAGTAVSRSERNTRRALDGGTAKADRAVVAALEAVLV